MVSCMSSIWSGGYCSGAEEKEPSKLRFTSAGGLREGRGAASVATSPAGTAPGAQQAPSRCKQARVSPAVQGGAGARTRAARASPAAARALRRAPLPPKPLRAAPRREAAFTRTEGGRPGFPGSLHRDGVPTGRPRGSMFAKLRAGLFRVRGNRTSHRAPSSSRSLPSTSHQALFPEPGPAEEVACSDGYDHPSHRPRPPSHPLPPPLAGGDSRSRSIFSSSARVMRPSLPPASAASCPVRGPASDASVAGAAEASFPAHSARCRSRSARCRPRSVSTARRTSGLRLSSRSAALRSSSARSRSSLAMRARPRRYSALTRSASCKPLKDHAH